MISELNDEEIMEFLMNSEFESDMPPAELKFLLKKWRYFYRLLHGRLERTKDDMKFEIETLKSQLQGAEIEKTALQMKSASQKDEISSLKNRKLTFRERWTGKIITKEDEDK